MAHHAVTLSGNYKKKNLNADIALPHLYKLEDCQVRVINVIKCSYKICNNI
jgi:hypothetical protein